MKKNVYFSTTDRHSQSNDIITLDIYYCLKIKIKQDSKYNRHTSSNGILFCKSRIYIESKVLISNE